MAMDRASEAAKQLVQSADDIMETALSRKLSPMALRKSTSKSLASEVQPLLDVATPFHVTHNVLRRIERRGLSVGRGLSFRAQMIAMSEARRQGCIRPAWALDEKLSAYAFIDALGIKRPTASDQVYKLEEVPKELPAVIKATKSTGSRGCYLAYTEKNIVHVRDNEKFESWDDFIRHANSLISPPKARGIPDRWMVEELIVEDGENSTPARDLKFYIFYGETCFVRESIRGDDPKVKFYNVENEWIETGRDEDHGFAPLGVTPEQVELVSRISKEIPVPFMRIDMLNGENGLVFGEFTPRPGNFDQFSPDMDRIMGEYWARAESRILEDMLRGKSFDKFLNSTNILK